MTKGKKSIIFRETESLFILAEKNYPFPKNYPISDKLAMMTVYQLYGKSVNNILIKKCVHNYVQPVINASKKYGVTLSFDDVFIKYVIAHINHEEMHRSLFRLEGLAVAQKYDILVGGKQVTINDTAGSGPIFNLKENNFMDELVYRKIEVPRYDN